MSKDLDEAKREVARLTELNQSAVIFKTAQLDYDGAVPLEKKPKSKKAKKQ